MLKIKYLFLYTILFSCVITPNSRIAPDKSLLRSLPFIQRKNLSLYTFELKEDDVLGSVTYGKAFIAECDIYTARHIIETHDRVGHDVINLGSTPIYGFSLCREDHGQNNSFTYVSDRGLIEMWIESEDDISFKVFCSDDIKPGDSGTPAICQHGNVIGLVSSYYPNSFFTYQGGIRGVIAKIPLDSLNSG
tara:strand:+ start:943 stop:1515 length:573 start_codon:yes stop_codon:yes gene_type:complete